MLEALVYDPERGSVREVGSLPHVEGVVVTPLAAGGALVTGATSPFDTELIEVGHLVR